MKIAVIGTGYVGLVTGTCLAQTGNTVACVDIDAHKVARMDKGEIPIYEPGLQELFALNTQQKRLSFSTDLARSIAGAEVIFLALPTPPQEDGSADLRHVLSVARQLGPLLTNYTVVVNKSTVPVGTAEKVRDAIAAGATELFDVVSNPEFLREGFAVQDFFSPDRIVVGVSSPKARVVMQKLYAPYTEQPHRLIFMDERSAEMTKYVANSFLALKISFMNEVANLSELVGTDIEAIKHGVGTDVRIGTHFLNAGIGYGGSCFPKDVQAFLHTANAHNYQFSILHSIIAVNTAQKKRLVHKITEYFGHNLHGKRFALWGLAFKANTDDIREAPSVDIVRELTRLGAQVIAYDPEASHNFKKHLQHAALTFVDDPYDALDNTDALLLLTEWEQFHNPDFAAIRERMNAPVIFDGRNILSPDTLKTEGFYYESMGRQPVHPQKPAVASAAA